LAARHARHRQAEPLLSARYEDPDTCSTQLTTALNEPDASGAVAVHEGRLVGYLLGAPKKSPVWGHNIWVEAAGQGLDEGADAELMRDIYALAATAWNDRGFTAQYVLTPASDEALLGAWYRLGFGQQHAHAIHEVLDSAPRPTKVTVRLADRGDIPVLARLDLVLPAHQALSPTFSSGPLSSYEDALAEWEEDFGDESYRVFVAESNGAVVGSAVGCALEKSGSHIGLARPERAGFLGFAAVFPGTAWPRRRQGARRGRHGLDG
jgi:hypothetical protein